MKFSIKKILLLSLILNGLHAETRPNILFLYLDDFGWKDTTYMGSDFFETPHIDKLAEEGIIFTNAYSSSANCAPARACLLSGQYTPRHEVYNVGTEPRGKAEHRKLIHVAGVDTLRKDIITWANCLQNEGYKTAAIGKWHLSDDPSPFGFDVNVAGTHSGSPPKGYYPPHPNVPNLGKVPDDEYLTDTLNYRACDFIKQNKGAPWILYYTHFAVHSPIEAKRSLLQKYKDKPPGEQHSNVDMASMIQAVDDGVGDIIKVLEETGQRENTVILFTSDNGGYGPATDMAPLRGYKGTYYEGGIRVPFFANWPGKIKAGQVSETPIIGVDLYPTICSLANVSLPDTHTLDGKDLVPLFTQSADLAQWSERTLFWHFPAYLQSYKRKNTQRDQQRKNPQRDSLFRARPCSIIRKGDWKLHEYFENNEFELYNLKDDLGEVRDLSETQPEKLNEMKTLLKQWRQATDAPVPTELNPKYNKAKENQAKQTISKKKHSGQKTKPR